jgi:hypothetical protein
MKTRISLRGLMALVLFSGVVSAAFVREQAVFAVVATFATLVVLMLAALEALSTRARNRSAPAAAAIVGTAYILWAWLLSYARYEGPWLPTGPGIDRLFLRLSPESRFPGGPYWFVVNGRSFIMPTPAVRLDAQTDLYFFRMAAHSLLGLAFALIAFLTLRVLLPAMRPRRR